jgi:trimethylamine--corrinoid protein Co-methyltransferase
MLSQEEKEQIHGKCLDLLESTGIKFGSETALKLLADAGCDVDMQELSAKIPAELVEKALTTAPREVLLAGRDSVHDHIYGIEGPFFISAAQSVFYRDLETRQRRASTLADVRECAILCNALDEIDEFCPMIAPNDVPTIMRGLRAGQVAFTNTNKHLVGGVGTSYTLPYHMEILDVLLGDRNNLKERPIISQVINDVSPLQKDGNLVDVTLALSEFQVPILLYYMPLAGSTAPVTLAGTLLEMTANMLSSIVLYQLAQPGWPVIWGAGPGKLEMRSGRFDAGAEAVLISIAQVEMAAFYGLPTVSGWIGSYESKEIDFQSGMDAFYGLVPVVLAGVDAIWGPGDLDGSNLVDLPFMYLGVDLVRQVKRLVSGINFDEDRFLTDVIAAMRFDADYLAEPSTKRFFRQEHLLPKIFPRESFETWETRGVSEEKMALAEVKRIIAAHSPEILSDDEAKEIERIVATAESVLVD